LKYLKGKRGSLASGKFILREYSFDLKKYFGIPGFYRI
jgi:hypothetical protein